MGKVIVKTAFASLIIVIALMAAVGLAAIQFMPSFSSDVAFGLGMDNVAVTFARSAYENKDDDESLKVLVDRAIISQNWASVIRYGERYVTTDNFKENGGDDIAGESSVISAKVEYYGYIIGNLAVAYYKLGHTEEAVDTVIEHGTEGYTEYCATRYLVRCALEEKDKDFAAILIGELSSYVLEDDAQAALRDNDIAFLQSLK